MNIFVKFLKNESGATSIEYGLIATLIAVAIIAALNNFADATGEMYNFISDTVTDTV